MAANPLRRLRGDLPSGVIRLGGRFTLGTKILMGLFAGTFVLGNVPAIQRFLLQWLVLRPAQALGPRPWQLLSGPLLIFDFLQLLFTGLLLYFIGSAVEQILGTRRFLRLCAVASLGAALCAAALGRVWPGRGQELVLFEATPVFMALLGAQAGLLGDHQATLFGMGKPLSVRTLSAFFIILGLVLYLVNRHYLMAAGSLTAALIGLRVGQGRLDPLGRLRRMLDAHRARRAEAQRRRFTILSGGLPPRPPRPQRPEDRRWLN